MSITEQDLQERYVQHGGAWASEKAVQQRLLKANAAHKLIEGSKRGNPYARRAMISLNTGLPINPADLRALGIAETLTSGDIPNVTSELMNRRLLAQFATNTNWGWRQYVPVAASRPDFRNVYPVTVDGLDDGTSDSAFVPENAAFPYTSMSDATFSYAMQKSIIGTKYSWESMVNDDLGAMSRLMETVTSKIIGKHGRFVTGLHTGTAGPLASLYSVGNGNIVTSNPVLSQSALELAFEILGDRDGPDGEPVMLNGAVLVVGSQALVTVAKQIQQALFTDRTDGTDVIRSTPTLPNFEIVYNPYVRSIATSNSATSWWLFPATSQMNRPWAELAFLQGFEQPRMFKKRSEVEDMMGTLQPNMGSFHNFSQEGAVMWAYGGTVLEPIVTVASNGTGS